MLTKDFPDFFNFEEDKIAITRKLADAEVVVTLPERDLLGRRVILVNMGKCDMKLFSCCDMIRAMFHNQVAIQDDEITSLTGAVYIFDGSNLTVQHLPTLKDMQFIAKTTDLSFCRIKKIILYRFPYIMNASLKFVQSFQSAKIRERTQVASEIQDIHRIVQPRSILPMHQYDGDLTVESMKKFTKELWTTERIRSVMKTCREGYVDYSKVPKKRWFRQ